jgi:hypothetical protein
MSNQTLLNMEVLCGNMLSTLNILLTELKPLL